MSASPSSGFEGPESRMPSFWVPPDAHGNGLTAERWAAILEVGSTRADELLQAMAAAGVPACSAPVHPSAPDGVVRIWVDPGRYAHAEDVLLREMSHGPAARPAAERSDAALDDAPPTCHEVKQLWWFCDGAIMDVGTRNHLWRARGLCARHSWMYFCAENELKYQPLGTAVLYEDLVGRALRILHAHRLDRSKRHGLAPQASCYTCDYLASARASDPGFAAERDQVEAAVRTREWLRGCRSVWRSRGCPRCLPARAGRDGVLCREHLIADGTHDDSVVVSEYLDALRSRLHRCVRSMTHDGPPREPDSDAALVEALGWFAGWRAGARFS